MWILGIWGCPGELKSVGNAKRHTITVRDPFRATFFPTLFNSPEHPKLLKSPKIM